MQYYFPILFLVPAFTSARVEHPPFTLVVRQRPVSTFDLATLEVHHKLHLPFQFLDVFLSRCGFEIAVDAPSLETAFLLLSQLRLNLYFTGLSPFLVPVAASHSLNEYAGINARDSEILRPKLPLEEREGLRSGEANVEIWPHELSLLCFKIAETQSLEEGAFQQAASRAIQWQTLERGRRELAAFREAVLAAPMLLSTGQSLLHMWCGLEALFPKVSTEVSFRLSLYLAQLVGGTIGRSEAYSRFRKSYDLRSKIAHGKRSEVEDKDWKGTWELIGRAGDAIIARGGLPSEEVLLEELLQSSSS